MLKVLHDQLDDHFKAVRQARELLAPGAPVFALEHALPPSEFALLQAAVRQSVASRKFPRDTWLPFVVYAAEVGYDYSGDEYWPTFESRTPGWNYSKDAHYLRSQFEAFASAYNGARPAGAWARQFSIICWPITHAVLPTDLQRQLARLLFEYRHSLTSEMLADPALLGRRLSARAWQYSSRFQNFAQNSALLGQVASALLVGEGETSPFVLAPTLHRLVEALSAEHQSRTWLRGAKSTASRVRASGLQSMVTRPNTGSGGALERRISLDPKLTLRNGPDGWRLYLRLPDLSSLAERLSEVHEELGRLRVRVAGMSGPPLASGQLRFPGREVRLDAWPSYDSPLFQLERASASVNALLADQCVFPPGPPWLFRVRDTGAAELVRGRTVRPAQDYVLVATSAAVTTGAVALEPLPLECAGVLAYRMTLPNQLTDEQLAFIRNLHVGCLGDVIVRPAGLVPASWDGEGAAAWLADDPVLIAIASEREIGNCVYTVDGTPRVLEWSADAREMFLQLRGLGPGQHRIEFSLLPRTPGDVVAEGAFTATIGLAEIRPQSGTFREGLRLVASPASPTLNELWEGRASIEAFGPPGAEAILRLQLSDRRGRLQNRIDRRVHLPMSSARWNALAKEHFRSKQLASAYDDADICEITLSAPSIGSVSLTCEREFAPLRWSYRSGFAVLVDNSGAGPDQVERFSVQDPLTPRPVTLTNGAVAAGDGGLLRASVSGFNAAVILPVEVHDLPSLQAALAPASVQTGPRTAAEVTRLIRSSSLWHTAELPGDPVVRTQRRMILRTLTRVVVTLIAGGRWRHVEEQQSAAEPVPHIRELARLVGDEPWQRQLANDITPRLEEWQHLNPDKRAEAFAEALDVVAGRVGLRNDTGRAAEFLLRLASDPGTLIAWPAEDSDALIGISLVSPVLARAARLIVLAVDSALNADDDATYTGWSWT